VLPKNQALFALKLLNSKKTYDILKNILLNCIGDLQMGIEIEDLSRIDRHGLNPSWFEFCIHCENGMDDKKAFAEAGFSNPTMQLHRLRKNTKLQSQVSAVRSDIKTYRSIVTEQELLTDIREAHKQAISDGNGAHCLAAIKLKLELHKSQKGVTSLGKKKKNPPVAVQVNIGDRLNRIKSGEKNPTAKPIDITPADDSQNEFVKFVKSIKTEN
jgi:hypothetical protein